MPATPPIAVEEPVVVSPTTPITANTVGDGEPITVPPVTGPVAIIVSITFVTVPGFAPAIRDAVASVSIGKIAITIAIAEVHVAASIAEVYIAVAVAEVHVPIAVVKVHVSIANSIAAIAIISTKTEEVLNVVARRTASLVLSRIGLSRAGLVRPLQRSTEINTAA